MSGYIGINGKARNIVNGYIGIDGKARNIIKCYIGDENGKAKLLLSFDKWDGTTLKTAWEAYKTYCEDAKVAYGLSQRNFKEELKNYFWEFSENYTSDDGNKLRR